MTQDETSNVYQRNRKWVVASLCGNLEAMGEIDTMATATTFSPFKTKSAGNQRVCREVLFFKIPTSSTLEMIPTASEL